MSFKSGAGTFKIEVDGQPEFYRSFSRMDGIFEDLTPVWPSIRDEFWKIEKQLFDSEGASGATGKWKSLSKRYNRQKIARYGPGKRIMEATGALRASLTGDAPGTYYSGTKNELTVGSILNYGRYHQRGSGKLPQRKVVALTERQKTDIVKAIQKSLIVQLRRGSSYVPVTDR